MPFSYHGFGPAAILIMVLTLVISEVYKYFKKHHHHHLNDK